MLKNNQCSDLFARREREWWRREKKNNEKRRASERQSEPFLFSFSFPSEKSALFPSPSLSRARERPTLSFLLAPLAARRSILIGAPGIRQRADEGGEGEKEEGH